MSDPTINFLGSTLISNGGSVLPFYCNSPHVIAWIFRGNVPANYYHVGWIRAILDTDMGENYAGNPQRLYVGKTKLFFPIFPFSPPYRLEISLKSWIEALDCQFYDVIPGVPTPTNDPQDPAVVGSN